MITLRSTQTTFAEFDQKFNFKLLNTMKEYKVQMVKLCPLKDYLKPWCC